MFSSPAVVPMSLLFIVNGFVTGQAEKFIAKHNADTHKSPLWDIGHYLLPDLGKYRWCNDVVVLIVLLLNLYFCKPTKLYFQAVGLIVFLRMISIYATILPKSNSECTFTGNEGVGGCHDKVFSGHIALTMLTSIFIAKSYPNLKIHLLILNILNAFSVIASRDHYTIDVLIAAFLSVFIGKIYTQ